MAMGLVGTSYGQRQGQQSQSRGREVGDVRSTILIIGSYHPASNKFKVRNPLSQILPNLVQQVLLPSRNQPKSQEKYSPISMKSLSEGVPSKNQTIFVVSSTVVEVVVRSGRPVPFSARISPRRQRLTMRKGKRRR